MTSTPISPNYSKIFQTCYIDLLFLSRYYFLVFLFFLFFLCHRQIYVVFFCRSSASHNQIRQFQGIKSPFPPLDLDNKLSLWQRHLVEWQTAMRSFTLASNEAKSLSWIDRNMRWRAYQAQEIVRTKDPPWSLYWWSTTFPIPDCFIRQHQLLQLCPQIVSLFIRFLHSGKG